MPEGISSAFVLTGEGKLFQPDYEAAHRRAVSDYQSGAARVEWTRAAARAEALEARSLEQARRAFRELAASASNPGLKASALLQSGRLSLAERRYTEAESQAAEILRCCPGARDEYGVAFALYAASQMAAAWEAQGMLGARFPRLASQLGELLAAGFLGHPGDRLEIAALAKKARSGPAAEGLLRRAEEARSRITRHMEIGRRLERCVSEWALADRGTAAFSLASCRFDGQAQLVGLERSDRARPVAVVFDAGRVSSWVGARAAERGRFEAALAPPGSQDSSAALQAPLLPQAPAFDLVLRARAGDPAAQRRQTLFAAALASALLLVVLVGYFALRDFSRELELADLRSNFVASVTHELKTPLTSVRLLAETLRMGRTRDGATAERLLAAIVEEAERLTRLVENVLAFSRIEKGTRTYRPTEVDLAEAIGEAVRRFHYVLDQEGFELEQESDGPVRVYADADGLTESLLNLLSNAVKYSGASRRIRLDLHRRGEQAEIRVTDWGMGIPRSQQRRIFAGFYRAPGAARETTGAGLGLSLVRHFAEAHGGRVTVVSEPGKGSAFSLWLPLAKEAKQSGQGAEKCAAGASQAE